MSELDRMKKIIKFLAEGFVPHSIELMFCSLFLYYLGFDLGLERLKQCTSTFIMLGLFWYLGLLILCVVYYFYKRHVNKKSNIEKLIDEELKK